MIEHQDLQVVFAPGTPLEKSVFKGFLLTITAGELVTVIGSNGAGKSTLLNVLSGEVNSQTQKGLQRGKVIIGNQGITDWAVMATLAPSKVLLLDEHIAALDPQTASYVLTLPKTLVTAQKLTTLMVTHSMRQAIDLGDRTPMLHSGSLALDISGDARKGLAVPDLLSAFASKPPLPATSQKIRCCWASRIWSNKNRLTH